MFCRVGQELNQDRKPEPLEPFFPGTKGGTGAAGTCFSGTETRTVTLCQTVPKHRDPPSPQEPSELKTGTAGTVPPPNHNRPEPGPPWFLVDIHDARYTKNDSLKLRSAVEPQRRDWRWPESDINLSDFPTLRKVTP